MPHCLHARPAHDRQFHPWLCCLIGLFLMLPARAEPPVPIAATPAWVEPARPPAETLLERIDASGSSIQYLRVDEQLLVEPNKTVTRYHHVAKAVVNQAGLERGSQLDLSFRPDFQTLTLHHLTLRRDGRVIDKTASARFTLIQPESERAALIYTGAHSLDIVLDDVRVGDIVDYSYSIRGANPVYQGIFGLDRFVQWTVPVQHSAIRVVWNQPKPLAQQVLGDIELSETRTPSGYVYRFDQFEMPAQTFDDDTPPWFDPRARIRLTETPSWGDIVDWALPIYASAVSQSEAVAAVVRDIRAQHDSIDLQVAAALRFVQDDIRYLGIEIGANSHQPSPASETLTRRYGDCKDKTILLIAILRGLGIEANPALVNSDSDQALTSSVPVINAFDHVIVHMELAGKQYWFDPTRSYQRGALDSIQQADFGAALVIAEGQNALTEMNPANATTQVALREQFDLSEGPAGVAQYRVTTQYLGAKADDRRYSVADSGVEELGEQYLDFYQGYYDHIRQSAPITVVDDPVKNRIEMVEQYAIPEFWEPDDRPGWVVSWFYANGISPYLDDPDQIERDQPLAVAHPVSISQQIDVQLPEDAWSFDDESFNESNPFFDYRSTVRFDEQRARLSLHYRYTSKTSDIPAAQVRDYVDALRRASDNVSYGIQTTATPGETTAVAGLLSRHAVGVGITLIVLAGLFPLLLWRIDVWRHPPQADMAYFPVSPLKFLVLWVGSLGIYGSYWCYRNWAYIKRRDDARIMPVARAIFSVFWYYPLYADLRKTADQSGTPNKLPHPAIAGLLAAGFLILNVAAARGGVLYLPLLLLTGAVMLPLLAAVNALNAGPGMAAYADHSKWKFRHVWTLVVGGSIALLTTGSSTGLVAPDAAITGERVAFFHGQFFQRKQIIDPGDDIAYFSSEAFFDIYADGNGFTDHHVFSYWKDETGQILVERAEFVDISAIDAAWSDTALEPTTLTISRDNGESFILYVSQRDRKDHSFVEALRQQWSTVREQVAGTQPH